MANFSNDDNIGLISIRRSRGAKEWNYVFVTNKIIAGATSLTSLDINYLFPLFLVSKIHDGNKNEKKAISDFSFPRIANLNNEILSKISNLVGLYYSDDNAYKSKQSFSPLDAFDYIYAVLNSPLFCSNYDEYLKIDFPKIPYPKNLACFQELVNKGAELRKIHLFESPVLKKLITKFQITGTNKVDALKNENGNVYVNKAQFFEGVPETAWNFYIGGYQPAQKWLKDRKGRILSDEDIAHYQKIIVALTETDRIMKEIDEVIEKHGGWDKVFLTAADAEKDD